MKTTIMACTVFLSIFIFAEYAGAKTIEFVVKNGDNFTSLSKKYQVYHSELIKMNRDRLHSGNPNLIFPGEKFVVEISDKSEFGVNKVIAKGLFSESNPSSIPGLSKVKFIGPLARQIIAVPVYRPNLLVSSVSNSFTKDLEYKKRATFFCFAVIFLFLFLITISSQKRDYVNEINEEEDLIGKNNQGMYHIITREGGISGNLKEVSEFIISYYGKNYLNYLGFVNGPLEDEIFGEINKLEMAEKAALDEYIEKMS